MAKELNILKQFLPEIPAAADVPVGPGDDCAAIDNGGPELLLAAVDQLIGDVHYYRDSTSPSRAGAKLLKRNLSDIAAMGGTPRWALLTIAADGRSDEWMIDFCRGVAASAAEYGVALCGGDTASLPRNSHQECATLTILGSVPRTEVVRRDTAQPGDLIFVTGKLGNSLASEHHLDFAPRLAEGRFLAQHHLARAMMDVSDGLLLDAWRMAEGSGTVFEIDPARLPLRDGADTEMALTDGEDYELLFTAAAENIEHLTASWPHNLARPAHIGRVLPDDNQQKVRAPNGAFILKNRRFGYEHQG